MYAYQFHQPFANVHGSPGFSGNGHAQAVDTRPLSLLPCGLETRLQKTSTAVMPDQRVTRLQQMGDHLQETFTPDTAEGRAIRLKPYMRTWIQ